MTFAKAGNAWILAVMVVALGACSHAPGKSHAAASTHVESKGGKYRASNHGNRSPYAPAQEDPSKRGDYVSGGLYAPHIRDSAPANGIADIDRIPEPEVRDEPRSRYGNRSPYSVLGKTYRVLDSAQDYDETGTASYYGNKFHGRRTSSLEVYDMYAFSAAHKTLPLPSFARVTNLGNGSSVVVRVNDRGPFHDGRIIDLSYAAAVKLGVDRAGTARVEVRGLSAGENARERYDGIAGNRVDPAPPTQSSAMLSSAPRSSALSPSPMLPADVHIATGRPQPAPPSAIDALVGALPIASARAGERPIEQQQVDRQPAPAAVGASNRDWRFDMRQDGKAMTADQFDAWMTLRRARVATGKAGKPDLYGSAAPRTATHAPAPAAETIAAVRKAEQAPPPAAIVPPAITGAGVTLQIAAFGARTNAEHALSMLRGAGVTDAQMLDAVSGGKQVWRLRVGPIESSRIAELSAQVTGLGFGQPQVVHE